MVSVVVMYGQCGYVWSVWLCMVSVVVYCQWLCMVSVVVDPHQYACFSFVER